jgi:hypothetical protein
MGRHIALRLPPVALRLPLRTLFALAVFFVV